MSAAALIFGGPFTEKAISQPRFSGDPFSLGVASGEPEPDGVVLWTRLAPEPLAADGRGGMPDRKVPVQWQVAEDPGFRRVVRRGTEFARPELAHSVHVEVEGLRPGREYFYRFKAGPESSPSGKTKTTPETGGSPAAMSFALCSCSNYPSGYFTAYRYMAEEDLDLVFQVGDYIYEGGGPANPVGGRSHAPNKEIVSLGEYRVRYAQYKSDEDLKAAHAAHPWAVVFDDHELDNNWADETPEESSRIRGEAFLRRRAEAFQAYYEHMPLRRSSVPDGIDMQLYRRFSYGNLAQFNILDTRQYRSDQAAGDFIKPPNPEQSAPGRTLTGDEQEQWLLDGLAGSRARWNVLAQQVFFAQRDFQPGAGELYSMDAWDGYLASRDRLTRFLRDRAVSNPVVLTGDVHNNWANDLLSDYEDPDSQVVGSEFVTTSVTSFGDGSDYREDTERILAENPHLKFFNNQRGYIRCTLTPEQWRTDYRVLEYVTRPGSPISTRASFVTEDGQPGVRRVSGDPEPTSRSSQSTEDLIRELQEGGTSVDKNMGRGRGQAPRGGGRTNGASGGR